MLAFKQTLLFCGVIAALLVSVACTIQSSQEHYAEEVEYVRGLWDKAVSQWDQTASDPKQLAYLDAVARNSALQMEMILELWDDISVPKDFREYHRLIREAMVYEKKAFETMAKYYSGPMASSEFDRLRRQALEYWNSKDEALVNAMRALPK